jgi:cyclopropane fatty-acyl-phospholipid synthase-like methyltransferase
VRAWVSAAGVVTRKAKTFLWERHLGIATRASDRRVSDYEHVSYGTVPYGLIFRVLNRLALEPTDVFVDLGCGRGRVCCCAARFPIAEVVGVEDVAELAEAAKDNLKRMRGARTERRRVICGHAQDLDFGSVTAVYMFHPFGPTVMESVIVRIKQSLECAPRRLRIAYVNPVHESVLERAGWLQRYDYWGPDCLPEHKRSVSFWRATTSIPR